MRQDETYKQTNREWEKAGKWPVGGGITNKGGKVKEKDRERKKERKKEG